MTTRRRVDRRRPKWMPKTKTFVLNALISIATVGAYLASVEQVKDYAWIIVLVTNVANILVRQYTDTAAAWTRPPAEQHGEVGDD
jgi:hypothetical protein